MSVDESDDVEQGLRDLCLHTPDAPRAARLRARCRAELRQPQRQSSVLGRVAFASVCLAYLSALLHDVLETWRML